jgi:biotin carboxyl carrier protein
MPGAVLRVLKNVGDTVEENEEILVIEAMKMETPIKSPVAGTVNSISVSQGDKVQTGQVMATVG